MKARTYEDEEEEIEEQEEFWDDEDDEVLEEEDLEGKVLSPYSTKTVEEMLEIFRTCVLCGGDHFKCDCIEKANQRVVHTEIGLTPDLLEEVCGMYSGQALGENKARGLFTYKGKTYVVFGLTYCNGEQAANAHEVVLAETWNGPAYRYEELVFKNGSGGPFHSNYQKFKCKGREWVILPDQVTTFVKTTEKYYQQSSLF